MADILVVTDETWVLNDVRAALSEPRFTLHEISDPREVARRVEDTLPDVVVVDLQIGSMGGMAVARAVRGTAAVAGGAGAPPVVLLLDRDADAFLAGRSGAIAWVRKPFSTSELRAAIDGALELSHDR